MFKKNQPTFRARHQLSLLRYSEAAIEGPKLKRGAPTNDRFVLAQFSTCYQRFRFRFSTHQLFNCF
jgi:hypothetical protein